MKRIGIMQVTDSLAIGGLERVAVNLANALPMDCFTSHICATRCGGPLEANVESHVTKLLLEREGRFDISALWRLVHYIYDHQIQILHAHGTSLFIAAVARQFARGIRLVWHDHFGQFETHRRSGAYAIAAKAVDAVISVSEPLAVWARDTLGIRDARYISNFVSVSEAKTAPLIDNLPGEKGFRIVCVANLRPQKDHVTLLKALAIIVAAEPRTHLLLAGENGDIEYRHEVEQCISRLGLARHVSYMGSQSNIFDLLHRCDIGVLSSRSEGLPLALLEYGACGIAAVVTNVGQCADVVDQGRVGRLVPTRNAHALANALLALIRSPQERLELGEKFRARVEQAYSTEAAIRKVIAVYRDLLNARARFAYDSSDAGQ